MLAEVGDGLVCQQQAVEGVAALVRHRGGVGGLTVVDDIHFGDADGRHGREIDSGGVHHHGRVDILERAVARHEFLATAFLFRRCTEQRHTTGQLIAYRR